jgi:uncharacterized membrane protein
MDKQPLIRRQLVVIGLLWLPFMVSWWVWDQVPDEVPIHWNARGEPDGWGHKAITLFLLPGITLLVNGLFWALPYLDPKQQSENFLPVLRRYQVGFTLFMTFLYFAVLGSTLGYELGMQQLLPYAVLGLLAFLGNYFGKIRPNYFVGLRLPWTLADEENWIQTHRLAGRLWLWGSLAAALALAVLGHDYFLWILFPLLAVLVLVPTVYSYWLFRKKQSQI